MSRDDLIQKLIELASKRFERPAAELAPDADFFEKLGIDSFQAMELMTDLEEEFDIEIPDEEAEKIRSNIIAKN